MNLTARYTSIESDEGTVLKINPIKLDGSFGINFSSATKSLYL
jgi:hypothetical protein